MQHPAMARIDRDAGVAPRVAGQRDQHDAGSDVDEFLGRREPSPRLPLRVVFDDVAVFHPLLSAVPVSLCAGGGGERCNCLGRGDVNSRAREVRCTADMVGIEVGEHDVANIVAAEPQSVELVCQAPRWTRTQVG